MDMVRLGIGLYGLEPNRKQADELKTVKVKISNNFFIMKFRSI